MKDFKNKTILIIGASSQIGFDNAIRINALGAKLILCFRDNSLTQSLKSKLGENHQYIIADIKNEQDVRTAVNEINGKLDGIVFAIGRAKFFPTQLVSETSIEEIIFSNFTIPVLFTKNLLRKKLVLPGASLVYYTSVSYQKQFLGNSIYSSSKIALSNFAKSLAIELTPKKIRSNSIAPGFVKSKQSDAIHKDIIEQVYKNFPNGLTTTEQVSDTLIFLLSEQSSGITGQEIIVDGGYSISL